MIKLCTVLLYTYTPTHLVMQILASLWTSVNLDSHIESFCKLGTFLEKWIYWI